jgi:predicted secreted protein
MATKNKTTVLALAIIFQLSFFSAVSATDEAATEANVRIITKKNSGGELIVSPGDIIQVELPTTGGTGYQWHMDHIDGKFLEFLSESAKEDSEIRMVGAPVVSVWQFKAKEQGSTRIKMDYYRKWEGMEKAADHFILNINVSDKRR